MKTRNQHFTVIVAGQSPEEIMDMYDMELEVEPYPKFKYNDANKYYETQLNIYNELLNLDNENIDKQILKKQIQELKKITPFDFYQKLTAGMFYDENTGDALSTENPYGRWETYRIGRNFSIPFKLLDGSESFQAKVKDIDWKELHCGHPELYLAAWEMIIDGREPQTDDENTVFNHMKERKAYLEEFETKEQYVAFSCSFWAQAFLDENGWYELENNMNQFEWVNNYFDNFIQPLIDEFPDTLLTIYECTK